METTDRQKVEQSRESGQERKGSWVVFTDVYPYECGGVKMPRNSWNVCGSGRLQHQGGKPPKQTKNTG